MWKIIGIAAICVIHGYGLTVGLVVRAAVGADAARRDDATSPNGGDDIWISGCLGRELCAGPEWSSFGEGGRFDGL